MDTKNFSGSRRLVAPKRSDGGTQTKADLLTRRDVIRMLDRELLGSVSPDVDETDADPASMI